MPIYDLPLHNVAIAAFQRLKTDLEDSGPGVPVYLYRVVSTADQALPYIVVVDATSPEERTKSASYFPVVLTIEAYYPDTEASECGAVLNSITQSLSRLPLSSAGVFQGIDGMEQRELMQIFASWIGDEPIIQGIVKFQEVIEPE